MHEVQKKFLQKYQRDCRKNKIYLLRSSSKFRPFGNIPGNITGAISLFLNITGAVAPVAPMLNTPLQDNPECVSFVFWKNQSHHNLLLRFTDL